MTTTGLLGLTLALTLAACATPRPVPTPLPDSGSVDAHSDIFTSQVFDCHLTTVAVERESASVDVGACLRKSAPTTCLVGLVGSYRSESVACVARDLGADANASFVADPGDADAKVVADAARTFILSEKLGYK